MTGKGIVKEYMSLSAQKHDVTQSKGGRGDEKDDGLWSVLLGFMALPRR